MRINGRDLGGRHPWPHPITGQVVGSIHVEGSETVVYPRGANVRRQTVSFSIRAWQPLGGQAALSSMAVRYLLKQIEELAANRDQQPCFIEWTTSDEPGAVMNASELHDGWYVIEDFEPDYERFAMGPEVICRMTVAFIAPPAPRGLAIAFAGGALATDYTQGADNLIGAPVGISFLDAPTINRPGAEGNSPGLIFFPSSSPTPVYQSGTLAQLFTGTVHVYDALNITTYPVPTTGGTFVNSGWVEVFGTDHIFAGPCVITNGLLLLVIQIGNSKVCDLYLWNPSLATPNWQLFYVIFTNDNAYSAASIRGLTLARVGPMESAVVLTTGGNAATNELRLRLQAGRYDGRIDFRPRGQLPSNSFQLVITPIFGKVAYSPAGVVDTVVESNTSVGPSTDFGFGAIFANDPALPAIGGFLYQKKPNTAQPFVTGSSNSVAIGDSVAFTRDAWRSYGFFAIPYGVSGTYSTANLQAEAESGTFDAGWSSVADAAGSGGNAAKCASGTIISRTARWGPTTFIPYPGSYDVWFRVRVTSAAGGTNEMQLGLWDHDTLTFVASTTYKPNQLTTTYTWVRAATGVIPTAGHHMRWLANTVATLGTDWFIDEAVMLPQHMDSDNRGPQDLWKQFMWDRSAALVVA